MEITKYILLESRDEVIRKKYSYLGEVLDEVMSNEFMVQTNFKYADWLLSHLEEGDDEEFIDEWIEALRKFDKYSKNLPKKDINQYNSLSELGQVIDEYTKSRKEDVSKEESIKIYEDERILIVRPLTHKASCKYGKGTKWCTTQTNPGYFEKYTSGNQALYYIIMKDFDINNKFYKMALNKNEQSESWYDSHDQIMPPREIDLLKTGLGKRAINSIEENYWKNFIENDKNLIQEFLSTSNRYTDINNYLNNVIVIKISSLTDLEIADTTTRHLSASLSIKVNNVDFESGTLFIIMTQKSQNKYTFDIGYDGENNYVDIDPSLFETQIDLSKPIYDDLFSEYTTVVTENLFSDKEFNEFIINKDF
jgi:hypothetical protein